MTERTVLDVAKATWHAPDALDIRGIRRELDALGIDPDMPHDKFAHALEVGLVMVETPERAANMTDAELAALDDEVVKIDRWLRWGQRVDELPYQRPNVALNDIDNGWYECLGYIRGDDQ